jgi:hypothetical protein
MATSGALTIGRERRAADAAEAGNGEAAALHVGRAELAFARLFASSPDLRGDLQTPLLSASRITGTTRPLGVSAAKPMWKYFL